MAPDPSAMVAELVRQWAREQRRADLYDAVQDARSDRGEWNEGDVADDAAEAFRWGFAADGHELEDSGREQ